ncbi:hypothetical protein ACFU99_25495 [Streptomyces sp. NPDC057654]|uniref:hypothetical protein n=1 Tax=Streptomyces sp. NPDC057654 TaxID=3346196 RepID=UPI0036739390
MQTQFVHSVQTAPAQLTPPTPRGVVEVKPAQLMWWKAGGAGEQSPDRPELVKI